MSVKKLLLNFLRSEIKRFSTMPCSTTKGFAILHLGILPLQTCHSPVLSDWGTSGSLETCNFFAVHKNQLTNPYY